MPDFAAARAALPGLTRDAFGEFVTFIPRVTGKMAETDDSSRPILEGVRARFDADFQIEQVGGGSVDPKRSKAMGEVTSVSVERRLLGWEPMQGDRMTRVHPATGALQHFRVERTAGVHGTVLLIFLSPI